MELFKIFGTISLKGADNVKKELNNVTSNAKNSSSQMNNLMNNMSSNAEKGTSKASVFLAVLGKVMKVIGATTLAVGGGAVALVKKVSSSYGALQQSIGGIETLFKDSADKVIKNANNAYTTAGISANEYMQQVTSFSASLLQALGGDTEKACDSADMAIRDMADNANKMGTSMEMIQNAYQGFSKQNYTMLDNLKLGYGGTKTEMQRLLKDAQKITGIKYDIKNLNDVYQAIHVIQGELGITGTTAKEAGETIEGSFNSLGASWENFLAGLGNPNANMKQLVDNLAKSINGAIKNVIPVINNMVKVLPTVADSLINAVATMAPTLIDTFTDLITKVLDAIVKLLPQVIPLIIDCLLKVVDAIIENLPLIVSAGMQLILGLAKGISESLPTLLPLIVSIVVEIVNILLENTPLLIEIGTQLILGLIQGLKTAIPSLMDMLPGIVETIVNILIVNLPLVISCGIQVAMALISGILKAIPQILMAVPRIIMAFFRGIIESAPKMVEAGEKLMGGLTSGVEKEFNEVIVFFKKNWKEILLSIAHPFNVAFDLLYNECDGFRNFINNLVKKISNSFISIGNFFTNSWQNLGNFITRPFVKAWEGIKKIGSTIKNFFTNLWQNIKNTFKLPHFKVSGSMNPAEWITGNTPRIGVEWYSKGGVMTKPTLFGVNPSTNKVMVGGESESEAIAPISTLQQYVSEAVKQETSNLSYGMNKLIDLLATYLPDIRDNLDRPLVLDSGNLVSGIADKMDVELGNISNRKARFGV